MGFDLLKLILVQHLEVITLHQILRDGRESQKYLESILLVLFLIKHIVNELLKVFKSNQFFQLKQLLLLSLFSWFGDGSEVFASYEWKVSTLMHSKCILQVWCGVLGLCRSGR